MTDIILSEGQNELNIAMVPIKVAKFIYYYCLTDPATAFETRAELDAYIANYPPTGDLPQVCGLVMPPLELGIPFEIEIIAYLPNPVRVRSDFHYLYGEYYEDPIYGVSLGTSDHDENPALFWRWGTYYRFIPSSKLEWVEREFPHWLEEYTINAGTGIYTGIDTAPQTGRGWLPYDTVIIPPGKYEMKPGRATGPPKIEASAIYTPDPTDYQDIQSTLLPRGIYLEVV